MPGKILGIDISEHSISAVQLKSGLKEYEVVSCFSTPIIDNNLEKALAELSTGFDVKNDRCILTIPASSTSFRNVTTPFKDSKKIRQTLPFEIETLVPFSVDETIIDYIHTDESDHSSVLTSAMNKSDIEAYIEQLKSVEIEPDIIDIRPVPAVTWLMDQETTPDNGIYLDLEMEHPCIVIFKNKKIVLIRELPCSFAKKEENSDSEVNKPSLSDPIESIISTICREADRTVFSFHAKSKESFTIEKVFFGGRLSVHDTVSDILNNFFKTSAKRIKISKAGNLDMDAGLSGIYKPALMDNALAAAIRESKKSIGFNFRRGEFALKRSILGPGKEVRRVAILICTFLVLMFINIGVDYYYINRKHTMVEEYFNKEFEKRLPEQKGVKGTKLRITIAQNKIKAFKNPSEQESESNRSDIKVLDILKEISERVSEKYDFDVNSLKVEGDEVTISATTDNYPTAEKITNGLKGSVLFKKIEQRGQAQDKDRIKFELALITSES